MRKGRRLAIDVGTARIGLAVCDPDGILAFPLEAVRRREQPLESITEILAAVAEYSLLEVIVGDPVSLSGNQTASTTDARNFATLFSIASGMPVRLVDERLSTVSASANLRQSGRSSRDAKSLVDSASAVVILEAALRQESLTGEPSGFLVGDQVGS
jgi:putative holliday junction resolvase